MTFRQINSTDVDRLEKQERKTREMGEIKRKKGKLREMGYTKISGKEKEKRERQRERR